MVKPRYIPLDKLTSLCYNVSSSCAKVLSIKLFRKGKNMKEKEIEKLSYCESFLAELLLELAESPYAMLKNLYEKYADKLILHILNFILDNHSPEFAKHIEGYDRFPAKNRKHGDIGLYIALVVGTEGVMEKGDNLSSKCIVLVPQEEVTYVIYEMEKREEEITVESVKTELFSEADFVERIEEKIFAIFREKIERLAQNCPGFQILYDLLDDPIETIVEDLEIGYEIDYSNLEERISELIE